MQRPCNGWRTGRQLKSRNVYQIKELNGGAGEARTPDLRFRKPTLYPSELQPRGIAKHRLPQRRERLRISADDADDWGRRRFQTIFLGNPSPTQKHIV